MLCEDFYMQMDFVTSFMIKAPGKPGIVLPKYKTEYLGMVVSGTDIKICLLLNEMRHEF